MPWLKLYAVIAGDIFIMLTDVPDDVKGDAVRESITYVNRFSLVIFFW